MESSGGVGVAQAGDDAGMAVGGALEHVLGSGSSGQDFCHNARVLDAGQALVQALVGIGEALVVDTQLMQDRRVKPLHM